MKVAVLGVAILLEQAVADDDIRMSGKGKTGQ
jgi:hypothetical protein